jgi:hypothetical protein
MKTALSKNCSRDGITRKGNDAIQEKAFEISSGHQLHVLGLFQFIIMEIEPRWALPFF